MKKFITLIILLAVLLPGVVYAQQSQFCRIQDATTRTNLANVIQTDLTFVYTRYGVVTVSGNYFDNGTTWRRWIGDAVDTDDIASTTQMPYVGSFGHLWDAVNDDWDRMTGMEIKLSVKDMMALLTYSANMFLVGDTWYDWTGAQANLDTVDPDTEAPYVLNLNMAYDATGDVWQRVGLISNQADGIATTLNSFVTSSICYAYNGATFDLCRLSDTNGLIVNVENWPVAFDAGNAWVSTYKKAINTYKPPVEETAAIGAAATDVIASKEVLGYPNITIYLENTDGADPFTDADIFCSPDETLWVDLSWAACDALAAGGSCMYSLTNHSCRYIKVMVTGAGGNEVSVDGWITANVN